MQHLQQSKASRDEKHNPHPIAYNKAKQWTILRHGILLEIDLLQLCEIHVQNKKRYVVFELLFSRTDQTYINLVQLGFCFFTEI